MLPAKDTDLSSMSRTHIVEENQLSSDLHMSAVACVCVCVSSCECCGMCVCSREYCGMFVCVK